MRDLPGPYVRSSGVTVGLVSPDGIPLGSQGERGQVGVGDRVVTRRNNRRLAEPGHGHVRNGSLRTVVATTPDGSLTVSPADRHVIHGCEPDPTSLVTLPAAYVTEHVDLGYATTAHRPQGLTSIPATPSSDPACHAKPSTSR